MNYGQVKGEGNGAGIRTQVRGVQKVSCSSLLPRLFSRPRSFMIKGRSNSLLRSFIVKGSLGRGLGGVRSLAGLLLRRATLLAIDPCFLFILFIFSLCSLSLFSAVVSQGCHNKAPHTEWLKPTDTCSLTVLEVSSPKSRCQLPPAVLRKGPSRLLRLLVAPASARNSLPRLCRCPHVACLPVPLCVPSSSYEDTRRRIWGSPSIHDDFISR